ncbi:MAG: hypothetical protein ILA34_03195 [Bacteroidaceae bacterium]|nr:hypothetical protein [Bacteroidaceae bacterium]
MKKTPALTEESRRKYEKYYLEAVTQAGLGHFAAQQELLRRALKYCPHSPEALFAMADLSSQNPLCSEEETAALYRKAIALWPDNNEFVWEFAKYQIKTGQADSATVLLERLTNDPLRRGNAYSLLGNVYEHAGKFEQLLQVTDRWEKDEGKDESIDWTRVRALMRLARYDDALLRVDSMCLAYPQSDYYPVVKAEIYLDQGDTARALAQNEAVMQDNPDNRHAQIFLVRYYQMRGEQAQLEKQIEKVILNPKQDMELRANFLQTYMKSKSGKGQDNQVDRIFRSLLQEPMESPELMNVFVSSLSAKNAPDTAYVPVMTKLLEIDPTDKVSRLREVWGLFSQKKYAAAALSAEEGIKYNPQELLLYVLGGNSCTVLKEKERAERVFSAGMPYAKNNKDKDLVSNYYSAYGDLMHEAGKAEYSYALYDSSLVYNPSNVSTLNNYAYFLALEKSELDKAERMAALAVKYEPDEPTFLDTYAWVCFVRGDYAKAQIYIEQALKNIKGGSTDSSLYEHAGDIYIHLGQVEDAVNAWKRALEAGGDSDVLLKKIKKRKYIENESH